LRKDFRECLACRGEGIEIAGKIGAVAGLIQVQRLVEQFLLGAEGGVEAGLADAKRVGQIADRGALIATLPE